MHLEPDPVVTLSAEQALADLYWAFNSPPMMAFDNSQRFRFGRDCDWFMALQKEPAPLLEALQNTNLRMLGPYFETLWRCGLDANPRFELAAHNVQVFDGGQTLGEMDFVLFDKQQGQWLHLEVAVKYYLGYPLHVVSGPTPAVNWIGPGCNDRLDIKSLRLTRHQSLLGRNAGAISALDKLGIAVQEPLVAQIALRGFLFYPRAEMAAPVGAHAAHLKGHWCLLKDLSDLELADYCHLSKPSWLAPLQAVDTAGHKLSPAALATRIEQHGPQLLQNRKGEKLFVVAEQWPGEAYLRRLEALCMALPERP